MFKVFAVRGNDDGKNMQHVLQQMKDDGYELVQMSPNSFEDFVRPNPVNVSWEIKGTSQNLLFVRDYLCVFRKE